jgi:hypothetical protein
MKRYIKSNIEVGVLIMIELHFKVPEGIELPVATSLRTSLNDVQRSKYNEFVHLLMTQLELDEIAYTPPEIVIDDRLSAEESISHYLTFYLTGPKGGRIITPIIRLRISDYIDPMTVNDRMEITHDKADPYAKNAKSEGYIKHKPKKELGFPDEIIVKVEGGNHIPNATFEYAKYDGAILGIIEKMTELANKFKANEVDE